MELDMADVKPSVISWVIVGIMAVTFIVFGKWLFTKYRVPGISDIFQAA